MPNPLPQPYTAAAVQWAPAYADLRAGVGRAIDAIGEAAGEGASLIVLPEAWLPGYPYWCTEQRPARAVRELYRNLVENSVEVPGPVTEALGEAAKRANATVVIGVTERAGGTLYNTLCYFGPDGGLLGSHRKLVPTLSESTVWGMGDGSDLDAYDTPAGRLSGLICYEHFMAPARYALACLSVEVHASVWPGYPSLHANVDAATRQLAVENSCAVVVCPRGHVGGSPPAGDALRRAPPHVGDERRQRHHRRRWEVPRGARVRRRNHPLRRSRPRRSHRGQALDRWRGPLQPPRTSSACTGTAAPSPRWSASRPHASRLARRCRVPRMPDGTPPLDFRVLNLARGVAGAYATRLLADLGANCSWWRWCNPRPGDWPPRRPHAGLLRAGRRAA